MLSNRIQDACDEGAAVICAGHEEGAPPAFRTDFARALCDNSKAAKRFNTVYPIRRLNELDEIAGASVFVTGPAGHYVNEQIIVVDGGLMI